MQEDGRALPLRSLWNTFPFSVSDSIPMIDVSVTHIVTNHADMSVQASSKWKAYVSGSSAYVIAEIHSGLTFFTDEPV